MQEDPVSGIFPGAGPGLCINSVHAEQLKSSIFDKRSAGFYHAKALKVIMFTVLRRNDQTGFSFGSITFYGHLPPKPVTVPACFLYFYHEFSDPFCEILEDRFAPAVLRTRVVFFTGISGKIIVKWKAVRTEIEKITVSSDAIPLLCQVEQIEDPRERQLSQMELTESWKSRVAQADWLIPYYDHILERLNSGKLVKDVPGLEDPLFFLFLNKTAEERKPLYRRAFSAQVCTIWNGIAQTKQSESKITPTKRFEKIYQSAVLSVLKQYSPLYEEGMSDEELLTAHGILTYAQTLEFKGAVSYRIDDGPAISTAAVTGEARKISTLEVPIRPRKLRLLVATTRSPSVRIPPVRPQHRPQLG